MVGRLGEVVVVEVVMVVVVVVVEGLYVRASTDEDDDDAKVDAAAVAAASNDSRCSRRVRVSLMEFISQYSRKEGKLDMKSTSAFKISTLGGKGEVIASCFITSYSTEKSISFDKDRFMRLQGWLARKKRME